MNKRHKLLSLFLSAVIVTSTFPSSGLGATSDSIAFYNSKKTILDLRDYDEAYDTNHDGVVNVFDVIRENKEVFQEESYTDMKSKIYSLETQIEILTQKLAEKEDITHAESDLSEIKSELSCKVDLQDGKQLSSNDYTNEEKQKLEELNNYDDTSIKSDISEISSTLSGKVEKEEGKQLSSNDYTDSDKEKLKSLENYDDTKINEKIDSLVQTAYEEKKEIESSIQNKVEKEEGKQLSSNDYTDQERQKLENLYNFDDTDLRNEINAINNGVISIETSLNNNIVDAYMPQKINCLRGYGINQNGEVYGDGTQNTGLIYQISNNYTVEPGETYYITACANWNNSLYSIFDSTGNVVKYETNTTGTSESTVITNYKVVIPDNASYMVIAWKTDIIQSGSIKKLERRVKSPFINKKWVCIGDSLTDNYNSPNPTTRYYDYISEETGIEYVMMGVGGSGYAKLSNEGQAFYQRILKAPNDADVYTIFGSGNDLSSGLPLGNVTDTDTTSICGCINKTLDNLYSINPIANVGIVSPTPWGDSDLSDDNSDWGKYVNALKTIAYNRGIPYLDLYHCSGLRPYDENARSLTFIENDSVHPNSLGHKFIAAKFKSFLESMLIL